MPATLASECQRFGQRRVKQQDRLGGQCAVFGGAKRQRADAAFPGHVCRAAVELHQRIGKPGPVHMQPHPGLTADCANGVEVIQRIHAADFGALGDADR